MNPLVLAQLTNMIGPLLGMVAQQAAARPSPEPQDQAPRIDAATLSALTALVAAASHRQEPQPAPKMPAMSAFVSIVILLSAIATMAGIAWLIIIGKADSPLLPVLCVGFGALLSKLSTVVDFWFGSSWGSKGKDAARSDGGTVVVSPPAIPALPAPSESRRSPRPGPRPPRRSPSPSTVSAGPPARARLACAPTCPATAFRRRSATTIQALNIRARALLLLASSAMGLSVAGTRSRDSHIR